ncbi:MAG: PilZ domain-containing protein [Desulfuromonadaceae bacterium]|nr:PilZ domain-containing protein [Desulfuromonadaceae bacterium]MDD5107114.1 PilZ domain-containing protein [Desulfuromonadaceae bacterium]
MLVIAQSLKDMVGNKFPLLNYYKEIPVSYDATLLNIENEMAEFSVHEYQAKVISIERQALIDSAFLKTLPESIYGEAFYVSSAKKRIILNNFGYARIRSGMRRFVRVVLDVPIEAEIICEGDILKGEVMDISIGGAAITTAPTEFLVPGLNINMILKLPNVTGNTTVEVGLGATIVKVIDTAAPYTCLIEFNPEKHSQQQISQYINRRQIEIIKELKDVNCS